MNDFHDPDISRMDISDEEKNGLQVYRNYSKAIETHKIKAFRKEAEEFPQAIIDLSNVLTLISKEEPRSSLVVSCAYVDDLLKAMFRREIPNSVPGGKSELLSGFGPLSRLSQRIQMAYAFGWLSNDLLVELDHLRKIRNDISHKWDLKLLESKLSNLIEQRQFKIEEHLANGTTFDENFHSSLSDTQKLRLRLIWLLGRATYETHYWVKALKNNLPPQEALYGTEAIPMLKKVSKLCVDVTKSTILENNG